MANELRVNNSPEPAVQYNNRTDWGKLSDVFQTRIRLCDKEGNPAKDDSGATSGEQIIAVAVDGDLSIDSQYSTPFDNSNPEHRLPTLMGMLQSGDWVNTLDSVATNVFGVELGSDNKETLNALEGRSNLTKTNSTQIFTATMPVTINMTLLFSAWRSAKTEVEDQLKLLKQWALPQKLEEGSLVANVAENKSLTSLFPSKVPPYVALYYGKKKYLPMLIANVSEPLVVPMDADGNRMGLQVQVQFLSRTAWDAENINSIYG